MLGRRPPIIVLCLLAVATSAAAQDQEWVNRGFIVVNGGYQATTTDFRDIARFTRNVEEGRLETDYAVDAGPQFDVSGGVRVSRNFGVGLGVSRFAKSGVSAGTTAFIPHPFYFNRLRVAAGAASTDREELVVHVQALLFVPVARRVEIALFGGPSLFRVRQELVSDVAYTETYPYNIATFQRAVIQTSDGSRLGFNVGVDVTVFFSRHVGAGGLVRLSRASVGLVSVDDDALRVDAGGLHFGAGLRLRF